MFDDWKSAERFAKHIDAFGVERALEILEATLAATQTITIGEYLREYANGLTGIEEETRKRYLRFCENDIDPFMGALPIDAYTEQLDAAWVDWLSNERGNAPKTVVNKHGFVSAGMAAAARRKPEPLVPSNPCAYTRLPRVQGRKRDYLTPVEYELLEAVLWPKYRPMLEFLVMSMCRPGEVFALTVGDIDPETGAVSITKAWKYAGGKRKLGPPKSSRGVRIAYVPLETIARLDLDRPRDELLFPTGAGTAFTVVGFYEQIWLPALRRLEALANVAEPGHDDAGHNLFGRIAHWQGESAEQLLARFGRGTVERMLEKWLVPYITRHTGISWRLQDGVPIWVVSRDAGHESTSTTDKAYGHIDARASLAAAEQVAGRLPTLRRNVIELDLVRRRRQVRAGDLGEIDQVDTNVFEAVWLSAEGEVRSQVFATYEAAVDHVAYYEAGEPLAA
ncbi:tyrosine-type recombinase/integrase [Nocardia sp. CA-145437]|uniref:tyrosine-type recombinase/integrase n=1 Tax=Nocardia sp. CA-145437 TaxID=3239980 RepID=UPI003D96AB38